MENRVLIHDITVTLVNTEDAEIEVTLKNREDLYQGKITTLNNQPDRLRAIAHATIMALNQILLAETNNDKIKIKLHDYRTIVMNSINRIVFLVVIDFIEQHEQTYLSGSSMALIEHLEIGSEGNRSVIKATLDAINRKLSRYIN